MNSFDWSGVSITSKDIFSNMFSLDDEKSTNTLLKEDHVLKCHRDERSYFFVSGYMNRKYLSIVSKCY